MSLLDATRLPKAIEAAVDHVAETMTVAEIEAQLDGANLTIEHLQESLADLELMLEDRGWQRLGLWADQQFSRQGLENSARLCRAMAVANPLIRRGLNLRAAYVWGGGVQIAAKAKGGEDGEQDVNGVIQGFLDDRQTRKVLTSGAARERNERTLGTDGNVFVALFTAPRTGKVRPRLLPFTEVQATVKNPEDRSEVWFYQRQSLDAKGEQVTIYHPDVDYFPRTRPRRLGPGTMDWGDQAVPAGEVLWDAPVMHVKVNDLADWDFGIGDAFAAIAWARAYKEFLEDWAKLVKALSRFAWKLTGERKGSAQAAAARMRQTPSTDASQTQAATSVDPRPVGQAWTQVGANLEAIPKTGATIDSESGKPLAAMVAAGLDVPVTMLLADPGVTGARATAETLDTPTENTANMRRDVWTEFYRRLFDYVIDQAVIAPQGPLQGSMSRDEDGRPVTELAGDTTRSIEITWPDLTDTPIDLLMKAIALADGMQVVDPLVILKLVLAALKVTDADEVIAKQTDEQGEFIPPHVTASQAAVDAFRRGANPAEALR